MRPVSALSIGCSSGASDSKADLGGFASGKGWALMNLRISYNTDEFDFDLIVPATQASYWGNSRRRDGIIKSFRNSYSVGLFHPADGQVGWVRATSDTVYHAYIYDLQVMPAHRGKGLGTYLVSELMNHPELGEVTGWMLSTRDHHHLYRPFGFRDAAEGRHMVLTRNEPELGSS